jgi:hypothetical protein
VGSISDYLEGQWINHLCGTAYSAPATVYVALCTADPTDAGTGASMNECANSGGYTRKAAAFGAASARAISNSGTITFDQASGSWGTVTHWALVDSATYGAGNLLAHGALSQSKAIVAGNTPSYAAGALQVSVSAGAWSTYLANAMLDKTFRAQTYNQPATYVGLTTTVCSDSAAGTEASGGSYARVLVNKVGGGSPAWAAISGGATSNAQAIAFAAATASWGTVVAAALFDASSGGNLLCYDNAMGDNAVASGDSVTFPIGDFDISVT